MGAEINNQPDEKDLQYQDHILQGVSRTFALTIPVLPFPLSRVVSNAYLLCRIADTIEDDKHLPYRQKREFSQQFINTVMGTASAEEFAVNFHSVMSPEASTDEHDLILNTPSVIRITHSFNERQRRALERCIQVMAEGMTLYQESNVKYGLKDQEDMDRYCYFVAGVVGEMLTELFCDYSESIDSNRDQLMNLAVSFGQGLQMTNILKDIWDDQKRGMCWLPQEVFLEYGSDLHNLDGAGGDNDFQEALGQLLGVARSHLANALEYTLLIPPEETGIRRFCLWALGLAVLTLRKINDNRDFKDGKQVKISRRSVKGTVIVTNLFTGSDSMLKLLFKITSKRLPRYEITSMFNPATEATPKI